MEERMKRELDNYITGHWGEDQVQEHEMRQTWEDAVTEFNTKNSYPPPTKPSHPAIEVRELRLRLMLEELGELACAMHEKKLVEVADSLVDLLYVVIGTAVDYGFAPILDEMFREVQRSNMSKDFLEQGDGRKGGIKGERYFKPDLGSIIDDYADAIKKINFTVDNG